MGDPTLQNSDKKITKRTESEARVRVPPRSPHETDELPESGTRGLIPYHIRKTEREVYFFMNILTTRKIALGLLIAFVLAFSVQDTAEALTLTQTSQKVQSGLVNSEFEIQFSIGLK